MTALGDGEYGPGQAVFGPDRTRIRRKFPSRSRAWARLMLALALATAPLAQAAGAPSVKAAGERLRLMSAALERDDCPTVLKLGLPLVDAAPRANSTLSEEALAGAYDMVIRCELKGRTDPRAYEHALRGTALAQASDLLWVARFWIESSEERLEPAVVTVEEMSKGRGRALNTLRLGWMWQLEAALKKAKREDLRERLLKLLADEAYAPDEAYGPVEAFRLTYARLQVDHGQAEQARSLVAGLQSPRALAEASLDPRLRSFLPAELDIRPAAEAQLARHRAAIGLHPDELGPLLLAAADLRLLGRPQEAVDLLQTAADRIDDPAGFSDRDELLPWWWDALARAEAALGRTDAAIAAFEKGSRLDEFGSPNISQVINLAQAQVSAGRADAALKTLAVFDEPERKGSPFGEVEMRFARGCAQAVAGRPAGAAGDLSFVKAQEKDNPEALTNLLLCLGDVEGAAASLIRRLEDPDLRTAALLELSDYDDPPVQRKPDLVESRLAKLKERDDVKNAIHRAGGVRRFSVQGEGL
jgi:tetratricopeptide (TPR) repeat protein